MIAADQVDKDFFYAFDAVSGKLYVSDSGGVEFEQVTAQIGEIDGRFQPQLRPDPERSAVLYFTASRHGLLRWSAGTIERLPGVQNAVSLGLGKAREGSSTPTLFLHGQVDGNEGLFRSSDDGHSWQRIDDAAHRFGRLRLVTGDPRRYGRVYLAGSGRGILYGDPR